MKIRLATVVAAVLAFGNVANGEDQDIPEYFRTKEFQKALYDLGVYWDRNILKLQMTCESSYHLKPIGMRVVEPMQSDSSSLHPSDGIWTVKFNFTRCKESIVYNALVIAREKQTPKVVPLVPGNTIASPQLIRDVYVGGVPMIVGIEGGGTECENTSVRSTQVTMEPTTVMLDGEQQHGVWEETWTVKHCNQDIEMTFCFIPDGKGGTHWRGRGCKT